MNEYNFYHGRVKGKTNVKKKNKKEEEEKLLLNKSLKGNRLEARPKNMDEIKCTWVAIKRSKTMDQIKEKKKIEILRII